MRTLISTSALLQVMNMYSFTGAIFWWVIFSFVSFRYNHSFRSPLTTGSQPLPQRVLHRVPSSVSSFNLQYPLISFRSLSSSLCLLPLLPFNSTVSSIFLSIMCFRRRLLRKIWPISLVFLLLFLGHLCTVHKYGGPDSSVGIATDYGLDGPGSDPGGDEFFRPSRPALGSTSLL